MYWEMPPAAVIVNGTITNSKQLKSYWRQRRHKENLFRRGLFENNRLLNTMHDTAPAAIPTSPIPVPQYQSLDQVKGMVLNLQGKLHEHLASKVKAAQRTQKSRKQAGEGIEL